MTRIYVSPETARLLAYLYSDEVARLNTLRGTDTIELCCAGTIGTLGYDAEMPNSSVEPGFYIECSFEAYHIWDLLDYNSNTLNV